MNHANIAIFVPHNGCPHQCSFCEQRNISGCSFQPTSNDVYEAVEVAVRGLGDNVKNAQIAFFGGSFTAIKKEYMLELLCAAHDCVKKYSLNGIRVSTRPDAIDDEILDILKDKSVNAIELGAQSMNDKVLAMNNRGHNRIDVVNASKLIKNRGFLLGLQMMTGLYGSNLDVDYTTGKEIADLKPDTVRIYPTIIMRNTLLHKLYQDKRYVPMNLDETISLCVRLLELFDERNIKVIRLGLHNTKTLTDNMVAGPWHPSFRELCESRIFLNKVINYLEMNMFTTDKEFVIQVNPKDVSKFIGQNKCNVKILQEKGYKFKVKQDASVKLREFIL